MPLSLLMRKKKPEQIVNKPSQDIVTLVDDALQLLNYMSREGAIELDERIAKNVVEAKFKVQSGTWQVEDETLFLLNYDALSKAVHPVTVESIQSVIPNERAEKRAPTKAEIAVAWYRRYALLALVSLLIIQVYYLFGANLNSNLKHAFTEKAQLTLKLETLPANSLANEYTQLNQALETLEQQFDANYSLLKSWNRIWMLGFSFNPNLPDYNQLSFQLRAEQLSLNDPELKIKQQQLQLEQAHYLSQLTFFEHDLFSDSILNVLQSYILPLLYGLLGAFIFVLRDLLREIKSLTFTYDDEIRYRLRLPLGSLAGMIVGWFLKPEEAGLGASLSPMALAFLMGYHVEILFAMMDKAISNIRKQLEPNQTTPQSK